MPQFRLTHKMAKELKIIQLNNPNNCATLYDDWYVDVMRVLRKKVIIFIHINTKIAFAIPIYEIGRIYSIFECLALLFRDFLYKLDLDEIAEQAYNYLNSPRSLINFVKTSDKSTLRYASTFKFLLDREAKDQILTSTSFLG
ncbi:DUF6933 domain-containing protein [Rickettsia gravesii]|uniref:DUF6933 domain-containing protein n=1 Tax=Rickettsia gravesii TaxID=354585 RepID=UPI0004B791F0|nr:hypothetical protein [Rickettsia gravesii]